MTDVSSSSVPPDEPSLVRAVAPSPVATRKPRRKRRYLLQFLATAACGVAAGVGFAAAIHVPQVDSIASFSPKLVTQIHDRAGTVAFASYARERRLMLDQGEIPPLLRDAILAAEDGNFFRHGGIDALGILRSIAVNLRRGRHAQGASTITMQLARKLFLTDEKSWRRKVSEAFLAVELEKQLSKQQILTMYCNVVFLGHANYGMESAARAYFGHGVGELTLPQAATLAGIVQRPSQFSPFRHPDRVVARRNYVLNRMLAERFISEADHRQAVASPLAVVRSPRPADVGPFFAEEVRKHLEKTYGVDRLYHEGLQVQTTLDLAIQAAAEQALRTGLLRLDHRRGYRGPILRAQRLDLEGDAIESAAGRNPMPDSWVPGLVLETGPLEARVRTPEGAIAVRTPGIAWTGRRAPSEILKVGDLAWFREAEEPKKPGEPYWRLEQEPEVEGAVLVLESATGAVRAMVGGWDFRRSRFNRATQALRQVGSSFKPFVFGAALENGFTAADTLFDAPALFPGADGLPTYSPRNYYRRYYGLLTLRRALELSVNVTSVKLMDLVGAQRAIDFARRCGITTPLPPYPSLALGSADLVPMEVAAAYATFANQGVLVKPYLVERVLSGSGGTLERHEAEAVKAVEPATAFVLTSMLQGVIDRGTGARLADLPLDIAGKTGTTNDYTDAWFVGYTPRFTILVWVGYDQKRSLGKKMTGAEAALPIWREIAESGLRDGWLMEGEQFVAPPGVEFRSVEYRTGLAATPAAERTIQEAFIAGTGPDRLYEARWGRILDLPWAQQRPFYSAKERERMPDGLTAENFPTETAEDDTAEN
ncbi:MAG: PBP1A family penicillin-binding protein [Thermoanaerobaculia bacterium]|nr:PBP1A family penicillin-binding protein [Thermoanaerobaculia bacterium]